MNQIMESGTLVEYIDRQKIICAVVLEVKNQRLRLLTENNREVNLSANRLSHKGKTRLDPSMGRDKLVESLKAAANKRRRLMEEVNIAELWEVLNTEQEWIDLATMTEFCFPDDPSGDHESAVVRAFFEDKLYFKFNTDRFFPNTEEQVSTLETQQKEAERKIRMIDRGANWLKNALNNPPSPNDNPSEFIEILKSVCLFEKESKHYEIGKAILEKAGIKTGDNLFDIIVKLGAWSPDENLDIYQYEIPVSFSDKTAAYAGELVETFKTQNQPELNDSRRDLSELPLITIDGQSTLDFDDALSIEDKGDYYELGVHIADVGHFVKRGGPIDREAADRASSIYMPDQKISMIPPSLAEDLCSLKAGEFRPAVSTLIRLSRDAELIDYEIIPSLIRVKDQLTYHEVNMMTEDNKEIMLLHDIAKKFREYRLNNGAVQISLPEINIWLDENRELVMNRTNRETPGRLLVSETMIMANWLTARFLSEHGLPAIFRSQPEPRDRLYKDDEGTLFQNWMQRRLLSRFVLGHEPEHHSGLGLNAYLTATSPIRKYSDLIVQRQIRSVFGLETPYTPEEIDRIIQLLEQPMAYVSRIQFRRKKYWLLKYLETRIGEKEEAIVLNKRKNDYLALLTEYMIECTLPVSGMNLKPEDMVQVKIQHVNARKDVLSVFVA